MNEKYIDTGRINQKHKTRQRIISSAQEFLKQGSDFSLEDVAEHAGISRATVYRYYSKVEILSGEAGLDLSTNDPETIYEQLSNLETEEVILGIQEYYNRLSLDNESAFRKYLSTVIAGSSPEAKRGARRNKTLKLALSEKEIDLSPSEKEKFAAVATVLMGMEAMIVTKDVCNLNNQESMDVLQWGLKMLMNGMLAKRE